MGNYRNTIGYKNNNYGNIRYNKNIKWQGQIGENKGFVVFDKPENGIRAIMTILRNYIKTERNTIQKIIMTYAPPVENDSGRYILNVSKQIGLRTDQVIEPSERNLKALAKAIVSQEIGMLVPEALLNAGYSTLSRKNYVGAAGISLGMVAIVALAFWFISKSGGFSS